MLYISTSVWMLDTPNTGGHSHFQCFSAKKLKKQEICSKFLQKTCFLKFAPKRLSTVLFSKKFKNKKVWKQPKKVFQTAFGCEHHPKSGQNRQHVVYVYLNKKSPSVPVLDKACHSSDDQIPGRFSPR